MGVIAQDVEKVFPRIASEEAKSAKLKAENAELKSRLERMKK
jgi:cell division protein FtsB